MTRIDTSISRVKLALHRCTYAHEREIEARIKESWKKRPTKCIAISTVEKMQIRLTLRDRTKLQQVRNKRKLQLKKAIVVVETWQKPHYETVELVWKKKSQTKADYCCMMPQGYERWKFVFFQLEIAFRVNVYMQLDFGEYIDLSFKMHESLKKKKKKRKWVCNKFCLPSFPKSIWFFCPWHAIFVCERKYSIVLENLSLNRVSWKCVQHIR